jgi:3-deoxy-D-manno-octulosonic-acid transferase
MPILLLALFIRSKSNSQYRQRLSERLGFFPNSYSNSIIKGGIIVHASSVGEVIALTPFVEQLLKQYPQLPITVTTFTPTGSEQVRKQFGSRVQHAFLPLDILPCTQLFLTRLRPKLLILMETELWPNLINQCASKKIKLLLINGRLSNKSMKSYQKISALIKPTLNHFDKILCQSQDNLRNFIQLGANSDLCEVSGNLKFDIRIDDKTREKQAKLSELLPTNRSIWLVASTHQGDEELALMAFEKVKVLFPELLLILVPRHPERFSSVAKLCTSQGYKLAKRSSNSQVTDENIWLLDTLGELMAAYALAEIVTMGGSFSHIGGHNPLEPALFKKPVIVGNDMSNFTDVLVQLKENQGVIQLPHEENNVPQQLSHAVINLLENPISAAEYGSRAHQVVLTNQGASLRTLEQVQDLLT